MNDRCKMDLFNAKIAVFAFLLLSCAAKEEIHRPIAYDQQENSGKFSYLALGDSYTIGESVAVKKSFPKQLEKRLEDDLKVKIQTTILAKTGWRTDNLLDAIDDAELKSSYDFVTLLIGVNNQYQGVSFSKYEDEFPMLLAHAIKLANNDPNRVIVVSIPDWAFTPFGQNRDRQKISHEIDTYNDFAEKTAEDSDVHFVHITDITREGLERPELVANDGLHPSGDAYKLFVERITPIISSRLND